MEQWRPVVGYEGFYEVSDEGRVRSLRRKVFLTVCQSPGEWGYAPCTVTLCKEGRPRKAVVPRLVLEAFVGPCPPDHQCCHFPDRDPSNNRLENLRWGTRSDNAGDREKHGTTARGELAGPTKITEAIARAIITLRQHGVAARLVAECFDLSQQQVRNIAMGRSWRHLQQ